MTRGWRLMTMLVAVMACGSMLVSIALYGKLSDARLERAQLTTRSDLRLCREIEGLKGEIRAVIRQSPPSAARAKALAKFAPRSCRTLPTTSGHLPHLKH